MDATLQAASARLHHSHGVFRQAVFTYLQAIMENCEQKGPLADSFISVLSQLLDTLHARVNPAGALDSEGAVAEFMELANAVCCVFGDNATVLRMLGEKCIEFGPSLLHHAQLFLEAALKVDSNSPLVKEILRNLFHLFVNRWHFVMLNDVHRNTAYYQAIEKAVSSIPESTVLDIGSGTGILSMMAIRSGARRVYGCEVSQTMAALSQKVLSANGLGQDAVPIINALSTSLCVPTSLPQRVSLVITETVDAGLLGEHIVPTLRHAWKELLEQPYQIPARSHVIPCGASIYATAIECTEIRKQSRLLEAQLAGVSVDEVVRLEGSCKLLEDGSGAGKPFTLDREPYTCESLATIRSGHRALTTPTLALTFDFSNPDVPLPPQSLLHLPVTASGKLDAIAVWFDLHLDRDTTISTAPPPLSSSTSTHLPGAWEQAIFPIHHALGSHSTERVREGDVVVVEASCTDTLLRMDVVEVVGKELGCLKPSEMCDGRPVCYIERSELLRLNDSSYIEAYSTALSLWLSKTSKHTAHLDVSMSIQQQLSDMAIGERGEDQTFSCDTNESREPSSHHSKKLEVDEPAQLLMLDMTSRCSVFGLIAAVKGIDFIQLGRINECYAPLLKLLAEQNGIHEHVSFQHLDVTRMPKLEWDLVLCDIVSPQGVVQCRVFEELAFLRTQYFHSESRIIPSWVTLKAVVISSPWLRAQSSVLGDAQTCGFSIASVINTYQVTHFTDIDLGTVPYTALSASFDFLVIDMNSLTAEPLQVENRVSVVAEMDGVITGIAYWFSLGLLGDVTVVTGPNAYEGSHWHQAVFMLQEDCCVLKGETMEIVVLLRDSCLDISLGHAPARVHP